MHKRIPFLAMMALIALALFAPAAIAQDYDDDDDNGSASATASATSSATAAPDDDDDDDAAAPAAPLPDTGGPALLAPAIGALLVGSGAAVGLIARRRNRDGNR